MTEDYGSPRLKYPIVRWKMLFRAAMRYIGKSYHYGVAWRITIDVKRLLAQR